MLKSLFTKVVGLKACNFIKARLRHRYFPLKFMKFLRPLIWNPRTTASEIRSSTWTVLLDNLQNLHFWLKLVHMLYFLYHNLQFRLCLENVLKTSLQDVLKMFLQDFLKTSWRRFEDVWTRRIYWSWSRRLEDVFWRRMTKANIFVLIKISWRCLQDVFWRRRRKTSSRRLHQD